MRGLMVKFPVRPSYSEPLTKPREIEKDNSRNCPKLVKLWKNAMELQSHENILAAFSTITK